MQAISVGDIYFLKSPFMSTVSEKHEKKIAYLLGTVSSRPAIIIRKPFAWDTYGTVEILPALSREKPAITFKMHDRYGYSNTCVDYSFCPHMTHSIPVSRLGRFIGRLSNKEFEELFYAYQWIHSEYMQDHPEEYPIPPVYLDVFTYPEKYESRPSPARSDLRLTVDDNMILHVNDSTDDQIELDVNFHNSITPTKCEEMENDPNYQTADKKVAEHPVEVPVETKPTVVQTEEQTFAEKEARKQELINSIEFPPSIFPKEDLLKYAGKFNYGRSYFNGNAVSRKLEIMTDDEKNEVRKALSDEQWNQISDLYNRMSPSDRDIIGRRVPTSTLAKMCHIPMQESAALKRLCNIMWAIPDYDARLEKLNRKEVEVKESPIEQEPEKEPEASKVDREAEYRMKLKLIRPYLTDNQLRNLPRNLMADFCSLPEDVVRKAYKGKFFKDTYMKYYKVYKRIVQESITRA